MLGLPPLFLIRCREENSSETRRGWKRRLHVTFNMKARTGLLEVSLIIAKSASIILPMFFAYAFEALFSSSVNMAKDSLAELTVASKSAGSAFEGHAFTESIALLIT